MRLRIATLVMAIALVGCTKNPVHPGAANQFDSSTYDTLVVAHSLIESTKADLANGTLAGNTASAVKNVLNNGLVPAYNALDTAYRTYHASALAGAQTAQQQTDVSNALLAVNNATTALASAKGIQ